MVKTFPPLTHATLVHKIRCLSGTTELYPSLDACQQSISMDRARRGILAMYGNSKREYRLVLSRIRAALRSWLTGPRLNVEELLVQLREGEARQRWEAAERLAPYVGQDRVAKALADALADEHPFVRWQAGESLAQGRSEYVYSLLEQALASRNTHRRSAAADVLGKLGDKRAVSALCKALESRSAEIRCSAAEALARLADPASLPVLLKALGDSDEHVRRALTTALGAIGGAEVVAALAKMLQDASAPVRASAAMALGKTADPEACTALRQALHDADPAVRWHAVRAAGITCGQPALADLQPLLSDNTVVLGLTIAEMAQQAIKSIEARQKRRGDLWR